MERRIDRALTFWFLICPQTPLSLLIVMRVADAERQTGPRDRQGKDHTDGGWGQGVAIATPWPPGSLGLR